jgi:AcrR family transcriptional regulator
MPTREEIISNCINLFLENGYTNTTMKMIGDSVGIKKPSLYAHFENKEDIGRSVMIHLLEGSEGHNMVMDQYSMKELVYLFLRSSAVDWAVEKKGLHSHDTLFSELLFYFPDYRDRSVKLIEGFNKALSKRIAKAVAEGEISSTVDPEVLAYELVLLPKGFHYLQNQSMSYDKALFEKMADNMWNRIKP